MINLAHSRINFQQCNVMHYSVIRNWQRFHSDILCRFSSCARECTYHVTWSVRTILRPGRSNSNVTRDSKYWQYSISSVKPSASESVSALQLPNMLYTLACQTDKPHLPDAYARVCIHNSSQTLVPVIEMARAYTRAEVSCWLTEPRSHTYCTQTWQENVSPRKLEYSFDRESIHDVVQSILSTEYKQKSRRYETHN